MKRRTLLAAGAAAALARPSLAQAPSATTLKLMPQSDLPILDPLNTTAYITRNHGHMVWDTLYGIDEKFVPHPQLAEGHVVEDEGRRWIFTLREGPVFHDGEKVLAKDAVASIKRWAIRDAMGQMLAQRWDEVAALDDRRFVIRLKRPFPLMLDALGKASSYPCFVYPERIAVQDPARAFTGDVIGSGPYRFVTEERRAGSLVVYRKFDRYIPRQGTTSLISGPKVANFERMEWHWIADASTAAAALQRGEMDWWENVAPDLRELLTRDANVVVEVVDSGGTLANLVVNHKHPPFDDPARRRALLTAVSQNDAMQAIMGGDRSLWRDDIGYFPVASPMANDEGLSILRGPRDIEASRRAMAAAGGAGMRTLMIHPTEFPNNNGLSIVGVDVMKRIGLAAESFPCDWGTALQRRSNKNPIDQGGWNTIVALFAGMDFATPAGHLLLRGAGDAAWFGWPVSERIEALRAQWFDAPDLDAQKALARQLQAQALQDVPYVPMGQYFISTAYRRTITGVLRGMTLPLNVKRVG